MNVKFRPENLSQKTKSAADKALREYVRQNAAKYEEEIKLRIIQNTLAATCLALSDQYGFGAKRIQRLIDGVLEILAGNNEEVYAGHTVDAPGENRVLDAMLAELRDRNIEIVIKHGRDGDGIDVCDARKKKEPRAETARGSKEREK